MASGFYSTAHAKDLDSIFMARVNTKGGDVGYRVGGTDISNRYEPIGSGNAVAATGFRYGGTDLNAYFRNINQPLLYLNQLYATQIDGKYYGSRYGAHGQIVPSTSPIGSTIYLIGDQYSVPGWNGFTYAIYNSQPQNYFEYIQVGSTKFYWNATSNFGYNVGGNGATRWSWSTYGGFSANTWYNIYTQMFAT